MRPLLLLALLHFSLFAACGDVQVKTEHPWYPGELSCSSFERLFKTQAELYQRVTGKTVESDEDKALAAWYWRNLHYFHGEEGTADYWGQGFGKGGDARNREYWTGLFAHGFGLCGTTHSQWTVEMQQLLGYGRARGVGVAGHNSFEAYLCGGEYGAGKWALLDHDISTVIFSPDGKRLLSIAEVKADLATLKDPKFKPDRQRGWRVSGLEDNDAGGVYGQFSVSEYMPGYGGVPPMVQLRAGESLRRYVKPGLEDGKTFVFWGRNYNAAGIPGPERSRTWVNQPEKMHGSVKGTGFSAGQARYANAVYTYTPNFKDGTYKEGVIDEGANQVTFEFYTPYVIACTPPNNKPWGIYDAGGTNGLVIRMGGEVALRPPPAGVDYIPYIMPSVSTDQGKTWSEGKLGPNGFDLTDFVKGHQQYFLRFPASAENLVKSDITIRTVCQCNAAIVPHLTDGQNKISFFSSGQGVVSAGPTKAQAEARLVDGKFGLPSVTLELAAPRNERPVRVYAASWQASGAPPLPAKYQIEYSVDAGNTWRSVVKDWQVARRAPDPGDFWSQSMCWGDAELLSPAGVPTKGVRVRFNNDSKRNYIKAEAHLVYQLGRPGATEVTFAWKEGGGALKTASHIYAPAPGKTDDSWQFAAGQKVETEWVEYTAK